MFRICFYFIISVNYLIQKPHFFSNVASSFRSLAVNKFLEILKWKTEQMFSPNIYCMVYILIKPCYLYKPIKFIESQILIKNT